MSNNKKSPSNDKLSVNLCIVRCKSPQSTKVYWKMFNNTQWHSELLVFHQHKSSSPFRCCFFLKFFWTAFEWLKEYIFSIVQLTPNLILIDRVFEVLRLFTSHHRSRVCTRHDVRDRDTHARYACRCVCSCMSGHVHCLNEYSSPPFLIFFTICHAPAA